jgi:hypothetical protein
MGGTPDDWATVARAALACAARGWPVVPMHAPRTDGACGCGRKGCRNPGKHPRSVHGFADATTDVAAVERIFRQPANLGLATGRRAGVWVLDVDGAEGWESLQALAGPRGGMPVTVESWTGGGGRHLFFRHPEGAEIRNTVGRIGRGLDTRSDGGGVVLPPSVHASGGAYEWAPGRSPDEVEVAEAPAWLLDLLVEVARPVERPPRSGTPLAVVPGSVPAAYAVSALDGEVARVMRAREGTRNHTLNVAAVKLGSLVGAGILDRREVEEQLTRAALACGLDAVETARTLRSGLGHGIANPRDVDRLRAADETRRAANHEAQMARQKRLRDNARACAWLSGPLGLQPRTVEHFGFGLEKPYESARTGNLYSDALTFPLRGADGTRLSVICKADVPGVTLMPRAPWWSSSKDVPTFYAAPQAGQRRVVVCDMPDLWRIWQELGGGEDAAAPQLVASASATEVPAEWSEAAFWDRWDGVIVATAATPRGEDVARLVHRHAGKPVHRMRPPSTTWVAALASGTDRADLDVAMATAPLMQAAVEPDSEALGRKAYRPLDIGRAFHNGHLYYPVDTLMTEMVADADGTVRKVERVETVVVRSDGRLLHAVEIPAPRGTPLDRRVMRLSDGTLIDGMPKAPAHPSWSWASINGWLKAKEEGEPVAHRPLRELVEGLRDLFRRAVWLPYEEDYAVLALTCAASYCQAVFQAVPLLLLCGEAGSGKSTAGITMAMLSANGTIVGQVNAAAAARLIHETKGLVVLDDLEAIGARPGKDGAAFGDLVQWLKVSYNRDTATKVWVDASRNFKVERLNGFGIKVVNNTTGVDSILGSRMLRIQARKMPTSVADARRGLLPPAAAELQRLRDELHAWTFDNVAAVARVYGEVCPSASERAEEIAAPLRVLARISGDAEHSAHLEAALARSSRAGPDLDDPVEVLLEAAKGLARQGFREISPTHVILETRRLVDQHFGQTSTTDIPEHQQPEWVGRMLRLRDVLQPGEAGYRKRLWGRNLRVYPFSRNFLADVLEDEGAVPSKGPTDFCSGCYGCPYRALECPMMEERMAAEGGGHRRPNGK